MKNEVSGNGKLDWESLIVANENPGRCDHAGGSQAGS